MIDISERFEEMVYTLKRLPPQRVCGYFNSWPPTLRSEAEKLKEERLPARLGSPSPVAITRMEECLSWLLWVDDEIDRLLIWSLAQNQPWKNICAKVGLSRDEAEYRHIIALLQITTRLNARRLREWDKKRRGSEL